jgi:hypothetical protein
MISDLYIKKNPDFKPLNLNGNTKEGRNTYKNTRNNLKKRSKAHY